ncbi:MAG: hypothetical protein U0324_04690 [Polyangiales bacterium]
MRPLRRLVAALLTLAALAATGAAHAWTEARPTGLATEVSVDGDGGATVAMRIRWTVLGGRMHEFDLAELPPDLALVEATAVAGNGATMPVTTRTPAPGRLVVVLGDEHQGVRRGTVDVLLRYTTSLRAQGLIRRAGSDVIVEVRTVPWARGLEGAELRVALPRAPRQAQWLRDETPGVEAESVTELSRDVVHAVRRHQPANEHWVARVAVDPGVFPWLTAGQARRQSVVRIASRPWGEAAAAAGVALAVMALLARALAKATPGGPDRSRRAQVAYAAGAVGVALPSLHLLGVPHALPAGVGLSLVALGVLLPTQSARAAAPEGPSRALPDDVRAALLRSASPRGRGAALVVAFAAVVTGVVGASLGHAWAAVAASELAVALLAWAAWSSRLAAPGDLAALAPVERDLASIAKRGGRARTSWRARGEASTRGSVRLRVVPRRGWRHARGVLAVECEAQAAQGALGEAVVASLAVRVEAGSPCERGLRLLATRAGTVEQRPEEGELVYRCALAGAERDVALGGLRAMMGELFVSAVPAGRPRGQRAADDERPSARTAG